MQIIQTTPIKMEHGGELKGDIAKFYKTSKLENLAKEVVICFILSPCNFVIIVVVCSDKCEVRMA